MVILAAAILVVAGVGGAVMWAAIRVEAAVRASSAGEMRRTAVVLADLFAPALASRLSDPRAVLVWQPLAATLRQIVPDAFAALDAAAGRPFPFSVDDLRDAHAKWTADWLAWERAHDGEYKFKAAAAEAELTHGGAAARAKLDTIEREKLELYQRRYEEYVRVAKALQALIK